MEQQHIDANIITSEAEVYKIKLQDLLKEKADLERQLIILEEQLNPYKAQIETAFGTTDHKKLLEIANDYLLAIKELEEKL